jgi:pimeloyl-ACP methyl ester carboxylesterase
MSKEIIHFAHANSFPAKTYSKLFSYLADDFEVNYLERHAHNPNFPVTDGWKYLAHELQAELENRYTQPIIGVGHSLGGILHFLVACESPELYESIVLLDSPLVSRLSGAGLKLLKRTRLLDKYSPSRTARFRRNLWETKDEVFKHFSRKELFKDFDKEVLRDYSNHGTVQFEKGLKLLFEPKIEAKIYRTIPDSFTKFRGKLKIPAAYIGGTHSREARLARLSFMKKHFPFQFYFIEGTHLFPFEKPFETAKLLNKVISNLSK